MSVCLTFYTRCIYDGVRCLSKVTFSNLPTHLIDQLCFNDITYLIKLHKYYMRFPGPYCSFACTYNSDFLFANIFYLPVSIAAMLSRRCQVDHCVIIVYVECLLLYTLILPQKQVYEYSSVVLVR